MANPAGEVVGETSLGDWIADSCAGLILRREGLSDSLLASNEPFRDFGPPRLYFSLKPSNQFVLRSFSFPSGRPQLLAKKRAFSRIILSVRVYP